MLCLTCTTISSVDLAQYGVSLARDWVSVECGTSIRQRIKQKIEVCFLHIIILLVLASFSFLFFLIKALMLCVIFSSFPFCGKKCMLCSLYIQVSFTNKLMTKLNCCYQTYVIFICVCCFHHSP